MHTTAVKGTPAHRQAVRRKVLDLLPALQGIRTTDPELLGEIVAKALLEVLQKNFGSKEEREQALYGFGEAAGLTFLIMKMAKDEIEEIWGRTSMRVSVDASSASAAALIT